jgi:hypothetical protein
MRSRAFCIINKGGGRKTRTLMTEAFKRAGIPNLSVAMRSGCDEYYRYERFKDKGRYHSLDRSQWTGNLSDASMARVLAEFKRLTENEPGERRFIDVYHD